MFNKKKKRREKKTLHTFLDSQLSSVQNNPYSKEAYLGMAYPDANVYKEKYSDK